jgi:alkylation response protein AidB-like acyl-CoA dehydrogenase
VRSSAPSSPNALSVSPARSAVRSRPEIAAFTADAEEWLAGRLPPRRRPGGAWGEGPFDVAVFHNIPPAEERALIERAAAWHQAKAERGYHAITWPVEWGGRGLSRAHERAFAAAESRYEIPTGHELLSVTTRLIAPTVARHGTDEQGKEFVGPFLRADRLCCQLFSEPGAGSDLAALACRAERHGEVWIINAQKVWSSGAAHADHGEIICRTHPDRPKHEGMTAFIIPMDMPGVEVRPIRQMSGSASFNEVFLTDVRVPDRLRLGGEGEGWAVALTTLGFERNAATASGGRVGGSVRQVLDLARHLGLDTDPLARQRLADLYIRNRILGLNAARISAAVRAGRTPGPEMSIGKLAWTTTLTRISDVVTGLLGPRLGADTGEWGTYGWSDHVLGAPGYRIAGGSDEIQRTIIAERVLGLPSEPKPGREER